MDIERWEQRVREAMGRAGVPGLAAAVIEGGEVAHSRGFGVTSVEEGALPVSPQTLFRVGSLTKPMTATLVLRLREAGVLDLDAPVTEYLPDFSLSDPAATGLVTLRMLLSHTAGLPTDHAPFGPRDPGALARRVREEIPCYPLVAAPGERFHYSNVGLHIAGRVAEVAGGRPYEELMQAMVFDPLGMDRTTFDPLVALTYPTALAHETAPDGRLRVEHRFSENAACHPSGYALSTVSDLGRLAQMLLGAEPRLLTPESLALMQRPQATVSVKHDVHYGLALFVETYKGVRRVGHTGDIRSYGAFLFLAPDHRAGVILLFNRNQGFWDAAEELMNAIFDELLGLPPGAVASRRAIYVGEDD